jgi:hypothetical protein
MRMSTEERVKVIDFKGWSKQPNCSEIATAKMPWQAKAAQFQLQKPHSSVKATWGPNLSQVQWTYQPLW